MSRDRPVVLFSTGPLKPTDNPYLHSLVAGLQDQVDVRFLSPWAALWVRPDVVHVHWPHQLAQGASRLRSLAKLLTSAVLLVRVALRRVPVVLTVHNLVPHEPGGRGEDLLVRALDRLVSLRVYLNESTENDVSRGVVVLHGSYRDWLRQPLAEREESPRPGGAILFGLLRPYKGIESLVRAAADCGVPLLVAGKPVDDAYATRLRGLVEEEPRAELVARHHGDDELVRLVRARDLVVLPYEHMYNSGALLYALSVGRPVLAPRSPANEALRAEVGEDWLLLYDGPLTGAVLREALVAVGRSAERSEPPLGRREWDATTELHRRVYAGVEAGPWRRRVADPVAEQRSNRTRLESDEVFAAHSDCNRPPRPGEPEAPRS